MRLFFAKRSWLDKHAVAAQQWTNAIARAQAWLAKANPKRISPTIAPFFPGLSLDENIAVVSRYRQAGVPIWASTTIVDQAGLAGAGHYGARRHAASRQEGPLRQDRHHNLRHQAEMKSASK